MNETTARPAVVHAYLDALDRALAELPPSRRYEIVQDVAEHIAESPDMNLDMVLSALGEPSAIAAEALAGEPRSPHAPTPGPRTRGLLLEALTIPVLAFGGFLFFIGWFIGVAMLWSSPRWTLRDKLFGTLLVPGGFFAIVFAVVFAPAFGSGTSTQCVGVGTAAATCTTTGGPSMADDVLLWALAALLILGPIYTAGRLIRRVSKLRRSAAA